MTITQRTFDKVIRFYRLLPNELINDILNHIQIPNRDIKRKLTKNKTNSDKVQFLLNSPLKKMFCDTAYNAVRNSVPFDLKHTSYEDIISGINDDNKTAYTIFFFRWCDEDDESGSSNYLKYFKTFVNSELFDKILNGKPLDSLSMGNQQNETDEDIMEIYSIPEANVTENIEKTETILSDEKSSSSEGKVHSMKLLGRIEQKITYYNFFPQYKLTDNELIEIPIEELKSNYPTEGGINLGTTFSISESRRFLEETISTDSYNDKYIKNVFIVEFDSDDLEPNANDEYQKKIDLQKIVQNGGELSRKIHPASDFGIYKVVTSEEDEITEKTFIDGNIILKETYIVDGEKVLLHYKEKYYGPFIAHSRAIDGKYYLRPDAVENNYIVNYFSDSAIRVIEFEKPPRFDIQTYSSTFAFKTDSPIMEDIIPDEVLLGKIADNISIEMANNNPDEFIHQHNNSPFFAKSTVPNEIIYSRINRLKEIVTSVGRFEEKKREVFETLLELYRSESSVVLEKIIKESQIYKDLEEEKTEARSSAERSANEILELNKIIKQLQVQVAEREEKSNSIATSERIKQLQEENETLKGNAILFEDVEKLKEEKKQLEYYEERLREKINLLSSREKTIRSTIHDAINNESKKMADLAFDPYISSEMMKAAASWDDEENKNYYSECQTKLSKINPSSLSGSDLIDYIVQYVKDRRDYSKNEIVNIYMHCTELFYYFLRRAWYR